jgi:two-component system sensor histidine kinase/response regulator
VLREQEQATGEHMPVIAMTAHATTAIRQQCLEAGMDDHISKPVRPEELFRAVESAAARHAIASVEGGSPACHAAASSPG